MRMTTETKTAKAMALQLSAEGLTQGNIATKLNEAGHRTASGIPFNQSTVWYLMSGKEWRTRYKAKKARANAKALGDYTNEKTVTAFKSTGINTFDVLRAVNMCDDIGSTVKKAVIALLLAEARK